MPSNLITIFVATCPVLVFSLTISRTVPLAPLTRPGVRLSLTLSMTLVFIAKLSSASSPPVLSVSRSGRIFLAADRSFSFLHENLSIDFIVTGTSPFFFITAQLNSLTILFAGSKQTGPRPSSSHSKNLVTYRSR